MHASLARRTLQGLVPPKIATPKIVSGDSSGPLGPLVAFYSKLPKGPAPAPAMCGLKGRWFRGKNASAAPVLGLIGGCSSSGTRSTTRVRYPPPSTPLSVRLLMAWRAVHLKHHKNNAH
ncbi:mitochondrial F1-F0 ATP synthase subunit F of fungi-domain-containing protein [Mycena sp. CBHHK59/15]|nr:mitochondrial F1-F0 ATP synthase subunit F of fungi-domain-containing protein [Mycena sp. CBHHK59/15]